VWIVIIMVHTRHVDASTRRDACNRDTLLGMRRLEMLLLGATALFWGSSFMFIKISIEELSPMLVMVVRCAIGGAGLWIAAALMLRRSSTPRTLRSSVREALLTRPYALAIVGLLTGLPLTLIAVAEQHVDSGLTGVINASVPLWAAVLAIWFDDAHRTGPWRIAGVSIGFAGVVLLAASRGVMHGGSEAWGIALIVVATFMYAVSAIIVRERLTNVPGVQVAAWSVSVAAVMFVVPALMQLPSQPVSTRVIGAMLALGIVGTFLGFLCYYELLSRVGATRAAMVTYLIPPFALAYGWLLLSEQIGVESLVALALILAGVWIGSREERGVRAQD
jgi:drug/metabolite transporter (DMT)-like permease